MIIMPNSIAFYSMLYNSFHPLLHCSFQNMKHPIHQVRTSETSILPILCSGVVLTPLGLPRSDNCLRQVWVEISALLLSL